MPGRASTKTKHKAIFFVLITISPYLKILESILVFPGQYRNNRVEEDFQGK
jgi:hypothetical protein